MTYDPNSRFKVVETLALIPGETVLTRSVSGPFIDSGVDLNTPGKPMFRGRLYLSKDEVREMAEQLGLFDEQHEVIRVANEAFDRLKDSIDTQVESVAASARSDGYAAGYAEKVDATADELVERMRARVQRSSGPGDDAAAAPDDHAAVDAPGAGAKAPVRKGRDDVPSAESAG